jgi:hypothetical protein
MNILQFFHKTPQLPPFSKGDRVRLKKYDEDVRLLYNKEYPNCFVSKEEYRENIDRLANEYLGWGEHIVSKIEEGTPASGGWFVYVEGISSEFHGNIFELVK